MSMPAAQRGYSFTGASSIAASIGRPDDAVKWLTHFIDDKGKYGAQPNTLYQEAGPVIETPLSAARSLQDIVLQSWGGTIRVFPGVPDAWKDVTIDRMRAEGAFLVSAVRRDGKIKWIRIESLAGEPCKLKADMMVDSDHGPVSLKDGMSLHLGKGESLFVYPAGEKNEPIVEPVAAQADRMNTFGLP
jgi:alpha-L-fucosidase 2